MQTQTLDPGDILECYGDEYEIILILGLRVTLRNMKTDTKGKRRTIETDISMIMHQLQDGFYKLKKKQLSK